MHSSVAQLSHEVRFPQGKQLASITPHRQLLLESGFNLLPQPAHVI